MKINVFLLVLMLLFLARAFAADNAQDSTTGLAQILAQKGTSTSHEFARVELASSGERRKAARMVSRRSDFSDMPQESAFSAASTA